MSYPLPKYEHEYDRERREQSATFIETSVSKRVFNTINSARRLQWNAAIVGAPGVGKTRALSAYELDHGDTIFLEVTPTLGGSLRALLEEIADRVGIISSGNVMDLEQRFRRWSHGVRMVILDEAQNLTAKSMRQLLHFSPEDGGELLFIFCGNNEVLKYVNADEGAFNQISRRVSFREEINCITDEDFDALSVHFGVEGIDAFKILRRLGTKFHADGVTRVLKMARQLANGKTLGVEHVREAIAFLPQYQSAPRKK